MAGPTRSNSSSSSSRATRSQSTCAPKILASVQTLPLPLPLFLFLFLFLSLSLYIYTSCPCPSLPPPSFCLSVSHTHPTIQPSLNIPLPPFPTPNLRFLSGRTFAVWCANFSRSTPAGRDGPAMRFPPSPAARGPCAVAVDGAGAASAIEGPASSPLLSSCSATGRGGGPAGPMEGPVEAGGSSWSVTIAGAEGREAPGGGREGP